MNDILTRLKNKKFLGLFLVGLMVVVGIPLTILQVQKSSENRSRASGEPVAIRLIPQHTETNSPLPVSNDLVIQTAISGGQNNITAIDITFTYDNNLLTPRPSNADCTTTSPDCNNAFVPSNSNFVTIVNDQSTPGEIHYVGVNPSSNSVTTNGDVQGFIFGSLHLVTIREGTAKIGFSNIHINAAGIAGALPIDTTNTKEGTYTIGTTATTTTSSCNTDADCPTQPIQQKCQVVGMTDSIPGTEIKQCRVPSPSITQLPSPSPVSGKSVTLYLSVPGIGPSSTAGLNHDPMRPSRTVNMKFFDAQNKEVANTSGTVTFQPSTGLFVGTIPTNVADGTYSVNVKLDNSLWKRLAGIVTINGDTNVQTQPATLIMGDFNGDNEINLLDYSMILSALRSGQSLTTQ